jgi:uroporphyrin-III C-methyltransferase / precorrin-2 dehydrogenase / sirohydrochlorin ferrochelatase
MKAYNEKVAIPFVLPGKVYLVGAGPGSAKLLTLRALEVLRIADVVLHDDLVSSDVIDLIPSRTAVHNVGKRCGFKKATQDEIHRRMISAARNGQTVVRLKGGDPLIFGRCGEEIRALRQAGISFEIVPGVTAATAAAAAAEITLTDRQHSSKLILASNHRCAEGEQRSWSESLASDATLVFYMPGKDFVPLCSELTASGVAEDTPCLLVSQAARPEQTMLRTSLRELAALPSLPAPAILIIGAAVAQASAPDLAGNTVVSEALKASEENETTIALDEPNEMSVR